jgi:hypothetical protein
MVARREVWMARTTPLKSVTAIVESEIFSCNVLISICNNYSCMSQNNVIM